MFPSTLPEAALVGGIVLGIIVSLSLSVLAWQRRPRPGATEFVALSTLAAIWLTAHGGVLIAPGPAAARTWFLTSQVFLTYLPVPWCLFTLAYADVESSVRRRFGVGLALVSTAAAGLIATEPWLGLVWDDLVVVDSGGIRYVVGDYSSLGWAVTFVTFVIVGMGLVVLARLFTSSGDKHRRQISLVALGALCPTIATVVRVLGVGPVPGFDLSPYAFVAEAVVLFWALFGFDLLDLSPVGQATLFRQLTDPAFVLDVDGRIVDYNPAAVTAIGMQGLAGRTFDDVAPAVADVLGTDREGEHTAGSRDERTLHEDVVVLEATGDRRYYDVRVGALSTNHTRGGTLCVLNDVTERMARERRLEALAAGTHRLARADGPHAVWAEAVDVVRETFETSRVGGWVRRGADERFHHVSGDDSLAPEDLVDDATFGQDVEHPRPVLIDDAAGVSLLVPVGQDGILVVGSDGETFDDASVRAVELLTSHLDASLARAIREQELARRNEQLEKFSLVLSHDLRNPLSVAVGYVDLLRERKDVADTDEFDRVSRALDRIETIVSDVLALVGDADPDQRPMALRAVTMSAWETTRTEDATIEYVGDDATVEADRSQLRQALENLFRNAVEHGNAEVVSVGTTDGGFYVEDDGSGLEPALRDNLFQRGVSGSGGTGIGMAVVRHVTDAHGWTVEVAEAAPDRGARFVIRTRNQEDRRLQTPTLWRDGCDE